MAVTIRTRAAWRKATKPADDNGFFGPGSVVWKVWTYPTVYILAFARAVTIEHFDPNLTAAVVQAGGVKARPYTRYGRTLRYFEMVAFGAAEPAVKAADVLVKVHSKAIGRDPVTGGEYDANRPDSQLWIHMTAWHSVLKVYEEFGPGRLSPAEENEYWAGCAEAAALTTADTHAVPRSREEVRAYFEAWRPRLAASEAAQDMVNFVLAMQVALPPDLAAWKKAAFLPMTSLLRKAVIATYPKYMRDMAGLRQSAAVDRAVRTPVKWFHKLLDRNLTLQMALMSLLAPQVVEVVLPALLGIPAQSEKVWSVRDAQVAFGYQVPSEAHLDMRARQRERSTRQAARSRRSDGFRSTRPARYR